LIAQLWLLLKELSGGERMRFQGQIVIGALFLIAGLLLLLGGVFDVDVGVFCFPTGLILLGIWILLRPYLLGPDTAFRLSLFGPFRLDGEWKVTEAELWFFIGDVRLDMTAAEIPPGETPIRIFAIASDTRLLVPKGIGVSIESLAFVTDAKVLDHKKEGIVSPVQWSSDGYETAERRVRLETIGFVSDIKVKQA
jgi:hypothetical protein